MAGGRSFCLWYNIQFQLLKYRQTPKLTLLTLMAISFFRRPPFSGLGRSIRARITQTCGSDITQMNSLSIWLYLIALFGTIKLHPRHLLPKGIPKASFSTSKEHLLLRSGKIHIVLMDNLMDGKRGMPTRQPTKGVAVIGYRCRSLFRR